MSEKPIFYGPSHATSTEEWLPHRILCVLDTSAIQAEASLDESDSDTWTPQGLEGPRV